ncbi:protein SLX4IP [Corythoichthys intestinalis]|uniref:protein SLX4IP n=1 Tax=Corythoichthys intestinalis TaxID=161448 RepID=UPI0025A59505|nr:protein SLX4IP [Corythoichthys intestinalis]XP_057704304.1 protein SLX4IP [Corythoichthys intestinalis]
MAPLKFVIKCGNFAVLVDLHVLPLGSQEDASWFTTSHIEEVTTLIRGAVDVRVQQYMESIQNGRQPKHKKELVPAAAFIVKGKYFNLVANFLKRHINLRCIVKQHHGELRVFPERYVVCVSRPEDATANYTKPSSTATELSEQSKSEYFSRDREIQESFNCAAKIKKTALQKIAQNVNVQQEQKIEQIAQVEDQSGLRNPDTRSLDSVTGVGRTSPIKTEQQVASSNAVHSPDLPSVGLRPHEILPGSKRSKRTKPSDSEDPRPLKAKRTGLASPTAATQPQSIQISQRDPLPPAQSELTSKAFPVSEYKKTTVEVELLTTGKRDQRLPLASNNTAQTKQNRLAASRRGLSVKLASSRSSISSRSTGEPEQRQNVPRTSRLRLKRS